MNTSPAEPAGFRDGVRLGLDVGDVRIGVAVCDPGGVLATPVETLRRGAGDLARLAELVETYRPIELVIGLPRSLSGRDGPAVGRIREYADAVAGRLARLPIRFVDERLTTVTAQRQLIGRRRGHRQRSVIDQAAAVVILQYALDAERHRGTAPGVLRPDPHPDTQSDTQPGRPTRPPSTPPAGRAT